MIMYKTYKDLLGVIRRMQTHIAIAYCLFMKVYFL